MQPFQTVSHSGDHVHIKRIHQFNYQQQNLIHILLIFQTNQKTPQLRMPTETQILRVTQKRKNLLVVLRFFGGAAAVYKTILQDTITPFPPKRNSTHSLNPAN